MNKMDILTRDNALLLLEYLKVLGWPIIVLIGIGVFSGTIKETIRRIKEGSVGDVAFTLSDLAHELTHEARRVDPKLKRVGFFRSVWMKVTGASSDAKDLPSAEPSTTRSEPTASTSDGVATDSDASTTSTTDNSAKQDDPWKSTASADKHDFASIGRIVHEWSELEGLVFDLHESLFEGTLVQAKGYRKPGSIAMAVRDLHRMGKVSAEDLRTFQRAQNLRNVLIHTPNERVGTYEEFLATIAVLKRAVIGWSTFHYRG